MNGIEIITSVVLFILTVLVIAKYDYKSTDKIK